MGQLFEGIDVLVTPTLGRPSFPLGTLDTARPDNFVAAVGPVVGFVGLANLTGQPAMSVPLSRTDDGMPVGSQFIGRYGDEHVLLRLAGQLERAYPWPKLPPMLGG